MQEHDEHNMMVFEHGYGWHLPSGENKGRPNKSLPADRDARVLSLGTPHWRIPSLTSRGLREQSSKGVNSNGFEEENESGGSNLTDGRTPGAKTYASLPHMGLYDYGRWIIKRGNVDEITAVRRYYLSGFLTAGGRAC